MNTMQHDIFSNRMALRIDVDFGFGLRSGVPYLLDQLQKHRMHATFCLVMGQNTSRQLASRLRHRGYAARLYRLRAWRLLGRTGGWPPVSHAKVMKDRGSLGLLARIQAEGHEIALHGFDHAWWADHAWDAPEDRLRQDIHNAFITAESLFKSPVTAWTSPHWRTTEYVLTHLQARGVTYFSDCWGYTPFITLGGNGQEIPPVHLPVTLPSLEPADRKQNDRFMMKRIAGMVDTTGKPVYAMACLHDYYEGILRRDFFKALLKQIAETGGTTVSLAQTARDIHDAGLDLPRCRLTRKPLPGFDGRVSWQAPQALKERV